MGNTTTALAVGRARGRLTALDLKQQVLLCALPLIALALCLGTARAAEQTDGPHGVAVKTMTVVDSSRPIKPAFNFKGTRDRRLDLILWYPTAEKTGEAVKDGPIAEGGPWPLVIYSHGTYSTPDSATHLVKNLVRHGYVVVAPTYPLTSRASFTKIPGPDITDAPNQPKDISFIIDKLLADDFIGKSIDPAHIGSTGISLGAVTSYFASYGVQTREPRIVANAMIGAGDPVQAALASDFGFDGVQFAPVSVPALFISGEKDKFAALGGRPHAAYSRIEPPKYEVMIKGAAHLWFGDGATQPPGGKNPDCLFFEQSAPDMKVPGCDQTGGLIDPAREKEITRTALLLFFDGYLKADAKALKRLRRLGQTYKETDVIYED